MEASSTTVNIQSPAVEEKPKKAASPKHTHGPNFGRYVAECPVCIAKYPDGPKAPPAKKERAPRVAAPQGLTADEVLALVAQATGQQSNSGGLSMDQLMVFARELKAPDPEEAEKKAADKKRRVEGRANMIAQAKLDEEQKAFREGNCNHRKENGRTAIVGQGHSDGKYHGVCCHCFKTFEPVALRQDQMQMGV